jgi:biopolymer transport protein TolR
MIADTGPFSRKSQLTTADLTPMLDTIFLIILLLLATLINTSIVRGFPVNLPAFSEKSDMQRENEAIEVSIDRDGSIYVAREPTALPDLDRVLGAMGSDSSRKVFVRADTDVAYGRVALVLCRLSNCLPGHEVILITHKTNAAAQVNDSQPKEVDE